MARGCSYGSIAAMGTLTAVLQRKIAASTPEGGRSFSQWLDALADKECDREDLIRGVHSAIESNPDAGWELLALVDQYYRRHRIGADDFRGLNLRVQSIVMGGVQTAEVAAPSRPPEGQAVQTGPPASHTGQPTSGAAPLAPKRTIAPNEVLRGRYRVQGILGRGGMGTVYAAIDQYRLNNGPGDQSIALKILHSEVIQRPGLLAELRGEFQSLQSLSHPNIVRVHEFDQDGDLAFFTMERLDGMPLSRMIAEQKSVALSRPYALAMIRQVSGAVAYAHSRGVVHGDLNPANIFVTDSGEIRVLDFGASYRMSDFLSIPVMDGEARSSVATPTFASCELLEGKGPTASDDVYALACISYVLLTGEHPFQCRNALAARKARQEPRRPPGLSYRHWRTLKAALSFDRRQRPADAQIWLDKFPLPATAPKLPPLPVLLAESPPPRSIGPWLSCVLIAVAAGACWWWAQDDHHFGSNAGNASQPAQPSQLHLPPANPTRCSGQDCTARHARCRREPLRLRRSRVVTEPRRRLAPHRLRSATYTERTAVRRHGYDAAERYSGRCPNRNGGTLGRGTDPAGGGQRAGASSPQLSKRRQFHLVDGTGNRKARPGFRACEIPHRIHARGRSGDAAARPDCRRPAAQYGPDLLRGHQYGRRRREPGLADSHNGHYSGR